MLTDKYSLYELSQLRKLKAWEKRMRHPPSIIDKLSGRIQRKINSYIPEKIHAGITAVVKKNGAGCIIYLRICKASY